MDEVAIQRRVIFIPLCGVNYHPAKYSKQFKGSFYPVNVDTFRTQVKDWMISHEPFLEPTHHLLHLEIEFFMQQDLRNFVLHDMTKLLLDTLSGVLYLSPRQVRSTLARKTYTDKTGIEITYLEEP